jgi:hypothetical protein
MADNISLQETSATQTPPTAIPVPASHVARPVVIQAAPDPATVDQPEVIIYSHSPLLYWWPVWVVGYIMAFLTYTQGQQAQLETATALIHPSANLGIFFFVTLFLVILITNITMRGLASALVIVSIVLVTVVLAYYGWWAPVLAWLGNLIIYLNLGAYFWFSTLIFLVWVSTVFVFDRMSCFRIKPGQVTHEYVIGASAKSYDTDNMVVEKYRDDFFRHWLLGLGAGDLKIHPYGANREVIHIPNVLFVGRKVHALQRMIATEPSAFGHVSVQ